MFDAIPNIGATGCRFLHPVKARRKLALKRTAASTCPNTVVSMQDTTVVGSRSAHKSFHSSTRLDNSLLVTTKKFIALKSASDASS
ncbi:hypothetical protein NECAME_14930 [Necator americanus]|uniref:Uncharacterized protein n=1 Tax=Necator americanus TaxID=51031 RepID=W2SKQ8_NECAM|nr:hypothetical protein NECAME_14930 [Necator americanus]ETN70205.1 hypothetical protein NECAME_14930 [Necator americanus]